MKLSDSDISDINSLLAVGWSDHKISIKYATTAKQIFNFRHRHNLAAGCKPGKNAKWQQFKDDVHPLIHIIREGIKYTLCPTRYAGGIDPQRNVRCDDLNFNH